jgi:hypothetical protein
MRIATLTLLTILCLALSATAFAGTLYNNGPTNGSNDAYFIDVYAVSDSFTVLPPHATMTGFTIAEWALVGDTPLTVDWSVGTSSFGSTYSGVASGATFSTTLIGTAAFGYDLWDTTVTTNNVGGNCGAAGCSLTGGTWYLSLTGATDSGSGRDGWDINSGPSLAYHNTLGEVPSESFTINGSAAGGTTPEPSSILLFGSGILGLAGVLRRKMNR